MSSSARVTVEKLNAVQHVTERANVMSINAPGTHATLSSVPAAAVPRPARSKFTTLPVDEQKALHAACAPGLAALGYN